MDEIGRGARHPERQQWQQPERYAQWHAKGLPGLDVEGAGHRSRRQCRHRGRAQCRLRDRPRHCQGQRLDDLGLLRGDAVRAVQDQRLHRRGEDTYLFGKSDDPAAWANSLNVWVRGRCDPGQLRVVARMPWLRVVLASKTGEITIGTEFHVTVTLGREGLWATLNGRMLNNGEKDPRHWYGWDHRVRGLRNNAAPIGSAQGGFNAGAIRIGKSSTGSRSNITVAQFAVFVTGTYANRLDLADCQAIADQSGAALGHPLFDNSTQAVALGASLDDPPSCH